MAGSVVKSHFICFGFQKTFHNRDVFCALSRLFVRLGSRSLCARLAVHYSAAHSVLGSRFSKQTATATATSTIAVYTAVKILCLFFCRSLQNNTRRRHSSILRSPENI